MDILSLQFYRTCVSQVSSVSDQVYETSPFPSLLLTRRAKFPLSKAGFTVDQRTREERHVAADRQSSDLESL